MTDTVDNWILDLMDWWDARAKSNILYFLHPNNPNSGVKVKNVCSKISMERD